MAVLHIATWIAPAIVGLILGAGLTLLLVRRGATLLSARRTALALATGVAWATGLALASAGALAAASDATLSSQLSSAVPMYILAAQLTAGLTGVAGASVGVSAASRMRIAEKSATATGSR